ncbi:MAG: hypothetical protein ACXABK_01950, partial [Candidatus Heimdallarchaeaceae archaeon]
MSSPEEMLNQLINSINKLSNLVQNVNEAINKLSSQIANLDKKIDGISTAKPKKSKEKQEVAEPAPISTPAVSTPAPVESQPAPATAEPAPVDVTATADAAFNAVSKQFKHVTQMISPQTSCGNITKMLEELRDEVETHVGMSPMLYELNSWVQKIGKMPETDILLPEVHSELLGKLDDWLNRVTKAIHLKY